MEPNRPTYSPTTIELDQAGRQLALELIRRYRDPIVARCVIVLGEIHIQRSMTTNG
jgi:hypothetical protein